ncbi:MAG: heavy metal translocating P-type ATPase [Blastocatellia bacterium]|nr:heavy metal translocating P-type ATPase [Blastocatellia bacterium]
MIAYDGGVAEVSARPVCDLCGIELGRRPLTRDFDMRARSFCCLGCMNVYAILIESGAVADGQDVRETELFKRSLALGLISNGERPAAVRAGGDRAIPEGAVTQEALFQVSGMWCSSCAWLIEHALMEEPGIVAAEAFFASDLVKVKYCPQYLPPGRIPARVRQLGYQASEYNGGSEANEEEKRDLLLRLGVAGFLWINIMTLSTALYVGYFEQIAESVRRFFPFVLMALAAPVVFYSAMPILRLAWQGLLHRIVRMETLLAIGILAAYIYSIAQAFRGGAHVYFDTASAIVTLVLLGKLIERNARERTSRAIRLLHRLRPRKARVLSGGTERFVSVEALEIGNVFLVKAGERIPADGQVIDGQSHADESILTGESAPVEKEAGSHVAAGSLNISNALRIRATRVGDETTLAQIIRLVEQAIGSKSNLERTVDRISRVFVPSVVVIALLTFFICWLGGVATPGDALMRAITVLVIACPCALGMATPLALTAAIGWASRHGILIRDSRVLETIRNVDEVLFDKTGTITEGQFSLIDSADAEGEDARFAADALPRLASLERFSEHPLGRAIVAEAQRANLPLSEPRETDIHKGLGITGRVDGSRVFIGNRRLVERESAGLPASIDERAREWERNGSTVAFFGWDGAARGAMAFGDRVRQDADDVIRALRERGVRTHLLSGDAAETTACVAGAIGADAFTAEALPDDKIRVIRERQQQGAVVAMIGDGINDAPALAQADLGIAVGSGADIAMNAASIVLMTDSLDKVLDVFDHAGKTWRIVRQNLFWAFFYNTLGISLAATGILNPIFAAAAMLLSSLSVIGNSMRLSSTGQGKDRRNLQNEESYMPRGDVWKQ